MKKRAFRFVLIIALSVAAPAAIRAVYCGYQDQAICKLQDICRQILDEYPEASIDEKGKDCTLTIDNRQLIIRRKRTGEKTGYFMYRRTNPPARQEPPAGTEEVLTLTP